MKRETNGVYCQEVPDCNGPTTGFDHFVEFSTWPCTRNVLVYFLYSNYFMYAHAQTLIYICIYMSCVFIYIYTHA